MSGVNRHQPHAPPAATQLGLNKARVSGATNRSPSLLPDPPLPPSYLLVPLRRRSKQDIWPGTV